MTSGQMLPMGMTVFVSPASVLIVCCIQLRFAVTCAISASFRA